MSLPFAAKCGVEGDNAERAERFDSQSVMPGLVAGIHAFI